MTPERFKILKECLEYDLRWLPRGEALVANRQKGHRDVTGMVALTHRNIGIGEFLVAGDVGSFRSNLSKCAELYVGFFQRFAAGEAVDHSEISMLAYKGLFDAMAAANFPLAENLARVMGGRPEIEKHDLPFTSAMGYALKETVLGGDGSARARLKSVLSQPGPSDREQSREDRGFRNRDFLGYSVAMDAIVAFDEKGLNDGLNMIIDGHIRQTENGLFHETIDADLCVWGIGLANLARNKNLPVHVNHELIPMALII